MKLSIAFLLLICISCNSTRPLRDKANVTEYSNISPEMNKFLLSFEKIVKSNKRSALIPYIDENYKSEQLGNLSGNMEQFIDELFCGNTKIDGDFICLKLKEIKTIRLIELSKTDENLYLAHYEIQSLKGTIIVNWEIRFSADNKISGYGFVGAYG